MKKITRLTFSIASLIICVLLVVPTGSMIIYEYNTPVVLLIGFEGWDVNEFNPSGAIADTLNGSYLHEYRIIGEVFVVDFDKALSEMDALLATHDPELVICLGLAPNAEKIRIETFAYNLFFDPYSFRPVLDMKKVNIDGAFMIQSSIHIKETVTALRQKEYEATQSFFPGFYLCNALFYHTIDQSQYVQNHPQVGFIHIPQVPPYNPNGYDITYLERAVLHIIEVNIE